MQQDRVSRRTVLGGAGAVAGLLALPARMRAQTLAPGGGQAQQPGQTTLVDPYAGSIPLVFPLGKGTYQSPLADNWHEPRDGGALPWSHHTGPQRAHDGVDIYPLPDVPLPTVYAPLRGVVASVSLRPENDLTAPVLSLVDGAAPPPWDYSQAGDTVSRLPLYGNFVWLRSTEATSIGYWVFFCHLQYEPLLRALAPGQPVTVDTPLGVVGDTGNAAGTPQLHVEVHYPGEFGFRCRRCTPPTLLTGFDAFASLTTATPRLPL
jgi:murein DD-endopeptidase MepM/ murein hydrolase activator NlpD